MLFHFLFHFHQNILNIQSTCMHVFGVFNMFKKKLTLKLHFGVFPYSNHCQSGAGAVASGREQTKQ